MIDRQVTEKHANKVRTTWRSVLPATWSPRLGLPGPESRPRRGSRARGARRRASGCVGRIRQEARASRDFSIPGRAELVLGDPPAIFDAAHNPDGAKALADALPELAGGREIVCCLAILEGKDAVGIVNGLAPACAQFVCTEIPPEQIEGSGRPGGRARPALEIAALCQKAGRVRRRRSATRSRPGTGHATLPRSGTGVALAAGSHYLLSLDMDREARSELLTMMGLVAIVVAVVILVFFALGYVFGLLFL